ncbi:helix-turn-helix transcriptional regulator [Haloactinopolyspora sp.]|uniref:helix-turn-helix domain-containing protein n=1 Tax=Haloactinopolyspora sp. TaxID=1966353 RepID=UPI00261FC22A|nr:helix-turn-helix transcriptional regulator [Haloactinopolyspora sp.]
MNVTRELARFLRTRRERLDPAALGLTPRHDPRRRTPGMRREEVAERANVSVDYVVRLEQGRSLRPSPSILDALSRALLMSPDERRYLFDLAEQRPPDMPRPTSVPLPPALGSLIDSFAPAPTMVLDHRSDILAWNPEMAELLTDFSALPAHRRNAVWLCLMHPDITARYLDLDRVRRDGVAHLRAAWAAHPQDDRLRTLIGELVDADEEFAELWENHDVRVNGHAEKAMHHPRIGIITARFDLLAPVQQPEYRVLVAHGADEASRSAMERLASPERSTPLTAVTA